MIAIKKFNETDKEQISFLINTFNSPDVKLFWSSDYHYVTHTKDSLTRMFDKNCGLYQIYLCYYNGVIGAMFLAFKMVPHFHRAYLSVYVDPKFRHSILTFCSWILFSKRIRANNIYRLYSTAYEYNVRSWKTMEQFSFEKVGEMPEFIYVNGKPYNQHVYSRTTQLTLLEREWLDRMNIIQ